MQNIGISGSTIKNFVKEHPISMALSVTGISAAAIYCFSLINQQKKPSKKIKANSNIDDKRFQKQEEQILRELNRLRTTRQKFLSASKQFQVEYLQEQQLSSILTQQCLLNIFDKCIQLVDEGELNRIYETSRKARRTVFHKILINTQLREANRRDSLQSVRSLEKNSSAYPLTSPRNMNYVKSRLQNNHPLSYPEAISFSQMYYRFVCTFEEEFKYLIQKTQKDFTTFLNIEYSLITQSIDYHISKDQNQNFKQKIQQWSSSIRQMLKNKLTKYVQTIDSDRIREILNYQISFMRQKRTKLQETIHKLGISNDQELQALPTFLATILQDAVYLKYQIQQQQMSVDIMHLSKNKQLQFLVEQFKELAEQIVQQMYEQVNKDEILNDSDYY